MYGSSLSNKWVLTYHSVEALRFALPADAEPVDRYAGQHANERHARVSRSLVEREDQQEDTAQQEDNWQRHAELKHVIAAGR